MQPVQRIIFVYSTIFQRKKYYCTPQLAVLNTPNNQTDRQTSSCIEILHRQEFCYVEMAFHAMLDTRTLRSRFNQVLLGSSIYLSSIIPLHPIRWVVLIE